VTKYVPLQSGNTKVLKEMNRKYTKEQYLNLVEKMKAGIPNLTLSTDIIVGFPGETDEEFEDTLDVVEKVKFEQVYMFIYSRRVGTPGDKMENQVPEEQKHIRFDKLKALVESQIAENNQKYVGTTQKVLVEGTSKNNDDMLTGRTDSNKVVIFEGDKNLIGNMIELNIVSEHMWYLKGEAKKEEFLQRIKKIEKSDFEKVVSKKMTLEEMAKLYNMDVKTLKQKIEDLASNDIEWNKLFSEYYGKRNDYNGYDFKSEMIQMLEEDMSQTQMAKKIGIPRETLTTKINQLSDNDELKQELKKHSTRKKNHRKLSSEEKLKQMIFVNEYREKNNIEKSREYEATKGSKVEQRLFYLNQILNLYNDVKENYPDLNEKQISEQLDFDPSTIRRYKREKELLTSLREKDMEK